jgi:drug/metabolite transporter superfamily protein YnfA
MNNPTLLRIIGNLFIIIGYVVILYSELKIGLQIKFFGGILVIPSLIQLKMWDGVTLATFFAIIETARLLQLYSH